MSDNEIEIVSFILLVTMKFGDKDRSLLTVNGTKSSEALHSDLVG